MNFFDDSAKESKTRERYRNWCFTLNNYTHNELLKLHSIGISINPEPPHGLQSYRRDANSRDSNTDQRSMDTTTIAEAMRNPGHLPNNSNASMPERPEERLRLHVTDESIRPSGKLGSTPNERRMVACGTTNPREIGTGSGNGGNIIDLISDSDDDTVISNLTSSTYNRGRSGLTRRDSRDSVDDALRPSGSDQRHSVRTDQSMHSGFVSSISDFNSCQPAGIGATYLCGQPEIGQSGTHHIQGVLCFTNPRELGGLKKIFKRAHWEPMRGTVQQAISYCCKEESRDTTQPFGFFEYGERPLAAGKPGGRSDLLYVGKRIREGASAKEIFEDKPTEFFKYARSISMALSFYNARRNFKTLVHWYHGATGTGKSRAACDEAPDAYWKNPTHQWWDGYNRDESVIIDDYRIDFCKFSELLRLFDRYPLQLQIKGGTVEFVAKKIIVTAPNKPEVMWAQRNPEDIRQLLRRIELVKEFK